MLMAHGTILGALFSANKIAIEGGIPFLGYAFWQSLGAGAILLVVSLVVGNPLQLSMAHLRTYIVTGVGGIAVPFSVYAYLAPKLPAGVITLVLTLIPPLTYLFAYALGLERFRWLCIAGILFGVAGVSLVVVPERWPNVAIVLRGDSGFARENLMRWCEGNAVDYVFGLARNDVLLKKAQRVRGKAAMAMIETGQPVRAYGDFHHMTKSRSWARPRRVIAKV